MTNLNLRKFVSPEIIFGSGARKLVGQYATQFAAKKVLIVTDRGVIESGWVKDVTFSLEEYGIDYIIFSDITPNPRSTEVMLGAEIYLENRCDVIISIGGGSPMDCAKGIGIVATNKKHINSFEGVDKITNPVPPLIFIPTTAGTSADVSQFCIISNRDDFIKIAIVSKSVVPDIALIDPETTLTMDSQLTAFTGVDALVHAIEAYVSLASGSLTDSFALDAIKLIHSNLPLLISDLKNISLREKMMLASMKAGLAFSNAILGAVHAMAHSLGGLLDLPHGECNALLLEHVINFNFDVVPDKFKDIAHIFGVSTQNKTNNQIKKELFERVSNFRKQVNITHNLKKIGVSSSDIPPLSKKAIKDACMITNPRKATVRDIEIIYESAM
ncbi:iron-containing alcohol dehydrogenase [bacterium]|nr:iron-containing alcohol dehydrogenase [bacterium]